ncbi:hypothetical protein FALCPG4_000731 [Fusarium falciforme]
MHPVAKLTPGLEPVFVSPDPARLWTHKRRHSRSYFSRLGPLSTTSVPLSSLGTGRSPALTKTQAPDPRPRDKNVTQRETRQDPQGQPPKPSSGAVDMAPDRPQVVGLYSSHSLNRRLRAPLQMKSLQE